MEATFIHKMSTYLSSQRIKVEPETEDSLQEKRERRVHKRQGEQVLKSNKGQEGTKCPHSESTVWGRRQKCHGWWAPLTCTSTGLSASTSPWAAFLRCVGDSITSSFLTPLQLVLHLSACILSWEHTSQNVCNWDSCESLAVQGTRMPVARGRKGSWPPRHKWSALLAGSAEPTGVGGHASEGQPLGVLLLLGKWEVPAPRPKENKPRTVQYTVCCLCDKDRPHCVCSTRRGPNQPKPK